MAAISREDLIWDLANAGHEAGIVRFSAAKSDSEDDEEKHMVD